MQGLQSKASGGRGVGRYTEELVKCILKNNTKHEFYLALNGALSESIDSIRTKFSNFVDPAHIIIWQNFLDTSANKLPDKADVDAAEILREMFFYSYAPDIIFSTNLQEGLIEPAVTSVKKITNFSTLFCTTLHDLVPFYYKKEYLIDQITSEWYYSKINYAIASDIVLTVSNSSKDDIVKFLEIDPEKVFVVENGYDDEIFNVNNVDDKVKKDILTKYNVSKPFIFYVGGNDPHKNIERLIQAYASDSSINDNVNLLIGGSHFLHDINIKKLITHLNLVDKIILPGFIDDIDLPILYKSCLCFIFPSTHEGFGLPALEAMACGIPVIGSNSSSIKEIINNPEALFDPYDPLDIAKKIKQVIFDDDFASQVANKGIIQAKQYSWKKSSIKLLNIFDSFELKIMNQKKSMQNPIQETINSITQLKSPPKNSSLVKIAESIAETFESNRKPKLYLDLSAVVVCDDKSGIQRVTRAISKELLEHKTSSFDVEIVYTKVDDLRFFKANKYMQTVSAIEFSDIDTQIEFNKNDILIYLDLHPSVAISHQEMTKYLRNKGVKIYHVVYDILPLLKPEAFWPELCREFRSWAQSISLSDGALCISKSVAIELKDYLEQYGNKRVSPFNIGWFHLGADIENSVPSVGSVDQEALLLLNKIETNQTFLMVGTIEPRKGHRQTLRAFELLWNENLSINLVIVGRLGWGMHDFEKLLMTHIEMGHRLFWLNGISDEYLEKIYSVSNCLIAASEGEGFGLPLIEAARHRIPIIARDIPVFREVVGDYGYYFNNDLLPETLSESIKEWRILYANNNHPLSVEMPYLTWKQSANQLVEIIQKNNWTFSINCHDAIHSGSIEDFLSKRLKFRGFSGAERDFRWTDGKESIITFYWSEDRLDGRIRILCGTLGSQSIQISLNNNIVFDDLVEGNTELVFEVNSLRHGYNILKFSLPDAKQPNESDKRLLALAFREFEIVEKTKAILYGEIQNFSSQYLGFRGFSGAERDFRWTDGKESIITFYWSEDRLDGDIRILCGTLGSQSIQISLNNNIVFDDLVEGNTELVFEVNSLRHGYNILKFSLPDAKQPNESDKRLLALAFREFEIV
jgi:glycosyltransferase involved in cell wall biosynthesis